MLLPSGGELGPAVVGTPDATGKVTDRGDGGSWCSMRCSAGTQGNCSSQDGGLDSTLSFSFASPSGHIVELASPKVNKLKRLVRGEVSTTRGVEMDISSSSMPGDAGCR